MSEDVNNLPAPIPQPDPKESERARFVATYENMLNWALIATGTMHELMVSMMKGNAAFGFNKFRTPNGRNCILVIGVGDDVVGLLTDVCLKIGGENGEEINDDAQDKDSD